ncbi:hypothetical protein TNCT_162351 [Trichonephila clavata]|uniref:Uncharacterized protein n=1 Tax=Trichonephila clavata TaxID=2740835 RepID=A0A8X6HSV2_TRICU|nr:hypothetical protein TNCT_162351 [Trichonephila clavata]
MSNFTKHKFNFKSITITKNGFGKRQDHVKFNLTSIENLRNNFANIKEEAIGLAKKWGITPEFEKKKHRKVGQFLDDFNADEKLRDRTIVRGGCF